MAAAAPSTISPTTSVAPAATATTVAEAIPATGASGLPLQLIIAMLSVAGGVLLVIGATAPDPLIPSGPGRAAARPGP